MSTNEEHIAPAPDRIRRDTRQALRLLINCTDELDRFDSGHVSTQSDQEVIMSYANGNERPAALRHYNSQQHMRNAAAARSLPCTPAPLPKVLKVSPTLTEAVSRTSSLSRRPFPSFDRGRDPFNYAEHPGFTPKYTADDADLSPALVELDMPDPSPVKPYRAAPNRPNLGQHLAKLSITGNGDLGLGIYTGARSPNPDADDSGSDTPRVTSFECSNGKRFSDQEARHSVAGVDNPFPKYDLSDRDPKDHYRQAYELCRYRLGQLWAKASDVPLPPSPALHDFHFQNTGGSPPISPGTSFSSNSSLGSPLTVIDSDSAAIAGPRNTNTSFGSSRSGVTSPTMVESPLSPAHSSSFRESLKRSKASGTRSSGPSFNNIDEEEKPTVDKDADIVHAVRNNSFSNFTNTISLYAIADTVLVEANARIGMTRDGCFDMNKILAKDEARREDNKRQSSTQMEVRERARKKLMSDNLTPTQYSEARGILRGIQHCEKERMKQQQLSIEQCMCIWATKFHAWSESHDHEIIQIMRKRYSSERDTWLKNLQEMEEQESERRRKALEAELEDTKEARELARMKQEAMNAKIKAAEEGEEVELDQEALFKMELASRRKSVMSAMLTYTQNEELSKKERRRKERLSEEEQKRIEPKGNENDDGKSSMDPDFKDNSERLKDLVSERKKKVMARMKRNSSSGISTVSNLGSNKAPGPSFERKTSFRQNLRDLRHPSSGSTRSDSVVTAEEVSHPNGGSTTSLSLRGGGSEDNPASKKSPRSEWLEDLMQMEALELERRASMNPHAVQDEEGSDTEPDEPDFNPRSQML